MNVDIELQLKVSNILAKCKKFRYTFKYILLGFKICKHHYFFVTRMRKHIGTDCPLNGELMGISGTPLFLISGGVQCLTLISLPPVLLLFFCFFPLYFSPRSVTQSRSFLLAILLLTSHPKS